MVTFRTDSSVTYKGFKATFYVSSCGGILTQPTGEFESPMHPQTYIANMECIWNITVEQNRVIELKFTLMDTEVCWRCECDGVEIYDGNNSSAPLIGRYCGRGLLPPLIKSRGNELYVRFKSDSGLHGRGFKAAYRTTLGEDQGCGGMIVNSTSGEIVSPDIDGNGKYEPNLDCWWHIIGLDGQVVKLTFVRLDIEERTTNISRLRCSYDFLEIRDGISIYNPLIDKYCGSTLPAQITASSNQLLLHFHSDGRLNKAGFKITYTTVNSTCGGYVRVTNYTQSLTSPNYPSPYPTLLRCRWHFTVPQSWFQRVHITFNELDIDCSNQDKVEFTLEHYGVEPFQLCGSQPPPMIMGVDGVWMTLITKERATNHKGFSLNYRIASCNMTYMFENGGILNPEYPSFWTAVSSRYCLFNITAPQGYTISLYFSEFRIGRRSTTNCNEDKMEIRDGLQDNAPVLGQLCGSALPNPIYSSGNSMSIYVAAPYGLARYFLTYTTTNAGVGCGGNITSFNGTVSIMLLLVNLM